MPGGNSQDRRRFDRAARSTAEEKISLGARGRKTYDTVAAGAIVVAILLVHAHQTREFAIEWGVISFLLLSHPIWNWGQEKKTIWRISALLVWGMVVAIATSLFLWPDTSVYISCDGPNKVISIPAHSTLNIFALRSGEEIPFGLELLRNDKATLEDWPPSDAFQSINLPKFVTSYSCSIKNRGTTTLHDLSFNFFTSFKDADEKTISKSHSVIVSVLPPDSHFDFYIANISPMVADSTIPRDFLFKEEGGLFFHTGRRKIAFDSFPNVPTQIYLWFPPTALKISSGPYEVR